MFELNGSYSDVQKTKKKTANMSRFWLPKVGTLDETIEERWEESRGKPKKDSFLQDRFKLFVLSEAFLRWSILTHGFELSEKLSNN